MKIVIISRATHPYESPRANRTHELAKQLAKEHNVTLYVLTGTYDYSQYRHTTGVKVKNLGIPKTFNFEPVKEVKQSFFYKIFFKLFHKILQYPYIELAYLTFNALKAEKNIDLLITIAVPHTIHWGAAFFRKYNIKALEKTIWVADCGDPFMGNPFNKHPFYFAYIEKFFCEQVDYISIPTEKAADAYYPCFREKIKIIPQGFNFENSINKYEKVLNSVPTFVFAGTLYKTLRDPTNFIDYLVELSTKGYDFKFFIYTRTKELVLPFKDALGEKLVICDFIPRVEILDKLSSADFLVNIENLSEVQSPSKLIDYKISGRPVLSVKSGSDDFKGILLEFLKSDYQHSMQLPAIDNFDIKNVAKNFVDLFVNANFKSD